MTELEARYARQTLLPGWVQEKLSQARVCVIGCDWLGSLLAWGVAALGVGHIDLLDDRRALAEGRPWLCLPASAHKKGVQGVAHTLMRLNPAVTARGLPISLRYAGLAQMIPACDVLVDTAGEASQPISLAWAQAHGVPLIQATAGVAGGACHVCLPGRPLELPLQSTSAPGAAASLVLAGLMLEEIRQLLLPLELDAPLRSHALGYHWTRENRFVCTRELTAPMHAAHLPQGALIIGGGALGTWVSLALALQGAQKLTIIDPDAVEPTNLNRQVLFYDAVGLPKSLTLAHRLKRLCPGVDAHWVISPVLEAHLSGTPMAFLCVDSFTARAQVNHWVAAMKQPPVLINGGTSALDGQVEVYCRGQTACLNCRLDIDSLAELEMNHRARCAASPEPSVVTSNMITAGLMVGEACGMAAGQTPLAGALRFESGTDCRVGMLPPLPACDCRE
jgi:molybdopterin/thiamine biosynthesis adenylyltransferase